MRVYWSRIRGDYGRNVENPGMRELFWEHIPLEEIACPTVGLFLREYS
jgi:hypothetical protein